MINWINPWTGIANLDDVRQLYRKSSHPVDGQPMVSEPQKGHIHLIGTNHDPLMIIHIDKEKNLVAFKKIRSDLAKHLYDNNFEVNEKGISVLKNKYGSK